jgi:glutamine cyclotransferase
MTFPGGHKLAILSALGFLWLGGCEPPKSDDHGSATAAPAAIQQWTYEVVKTHPHDRRSFTQGLVYDGGKFLESAGQTGISDLRRVEIETGKVLQKTMVERQYFAEGLAVLHNRLWQLTYLHGVCITYDPKSFKVLAKLSYEGEGWGLTTDGKSLIMSDGTSKIRFRSPKDFKIERSIEVFVDNDSSRPLYNLNELEWVDGEIFANVWHTDLVYRIDPSDGKVLGIVDFSGIHEREPSEEAVLNGIAYDPETKRLWVTGKLWSKLYEVKLKKK